MTATIKTKLTTFEDAVDVGITFFGMSLEDLGISVHATENTLRLCTVNSRRGEDGTLQQDVFTLMHGDLDTFTLTGPESSTTINVDLYDRDLMLTSAFISAVYLICNSGPEVVLSRIVIEGRERIIPITVRPFAEAKLSDSISVTRLRFVEDRVRLSSIVTDRKVYVIRGRATSTFAVSRDQKGWNVSLEQSDVVAEKALGTGMSMLLALRLAGSVAAYGNNPEPLLDETLTLEEFAETIHPLQTVLLPFAALDTEGDHVSVHDRKGFMLDMCGAMKQNGLVVEPRDNELIFFLRNDMLMEDRLAAPSPMERVVVLRKVEAGKGSEEFVYSIARAVAQNGFGENVNTYFLLREYSNKVVQVTQGTCDGIEVLAEAINLITGA